MKGITYLWGRGYTNGISTVNNNVDIYMILCGYDLNLHPCGGGVLVVKTECYVAC